MVVEWLKKVFGLRSKQKNTFSEISISVRIQIGQNTLEDTFKILSGYGNLIPPNEGFVYWAGIKEKNRFKVTAVIAPDVISSEQRVVVTQKANIALIQLLSRFGIKLIGQVHSHPSSWVGHSEGDNKFAAFKKENLVSIVVPNYSKKPFKLTDCGIHVYKNGAFRRLSDSEISNYFSLNSGFKTELFDIRSTA